MSLVNLPERLIYKMIKAVDTGNTIRLLLIDQTIIIVAGEEKGITQKILNNKNAEQ
jgi:hypothetical protein